MIKISHMMPIALLPKYDHYSDIRLILPKFFEGNNELSKAYYQFVKKCKKLKILDNMAYESKKSIDFDKLIKYAVDLDVDVIVCPDAWCDMQTTIMLTNEFLQYYFSKHKKNRRVLMGVIQGSNEREWIECAREFARDTRIGMLGVAFLTTAKCFSSTTGTDDKNVLPNRVYAVQILKQFTKKKIHLLGLGNPYELVAYANDPQVVSVDSSIAYHASAEGVVLSHKYVRMSYGYLRNHVYDTSFSDELLKLLEINLNIVREIIQLGAEGLHEIFKG